MADALTVATSASDAVSDGLWGKNNSVAKRKPVCNLFHALEDGMPFLCIFNNVHRWNLSALWPQIEFAKVMRSVVPGDTAVSFFFSAAVSTVSWNPDVGRRMWPMNTK